jgi:hypothetical protein
LGRSFIAFVFYALSLIFPYPSLYNVLVSVSFLDAFALFCYGYCASRQMKYFGYKLVVVSSLEGVPLVYSLVPAHSDEREAAESVLQFIQGCDIGCIPLKIIH